jgi:3-hydroxyisobutyrate dehydrogenase-like beta-hydroxyacid dehydrogenase
VKVGFVGLGGMGSAMAANLLKAGHEVRVWSRRPEPADRLRELGAHVVDRPHAAFQGDAFVSMLSDDAAVRAVVVEGGLFAAKTDTIHISSATISVALADELTALQEKAGAPYLAAPVFGRPQAAAAAKLHVVAAGDPALIAKVQPLFDAIGQTTWIVGDRPSQANVVKICGNFMLASAIETLSEASALANAHDIPTKIFLALMTSTLFASPAYQIYGKIITDQSFEPAGFRLKLGFKDLRLALAASEALNVPLPFGAALRDVFLEAIADGLEDVDWSAISQVAQRRAHLPAIPRTGNNDERHPAHPGPSDANPNWRGRHRQGCSVITLFLAEEPLIANRY